ncbi:MAG: hypothetical protein JXR94_00135 [Candidatus Hydrogenedentes bacterium]|nr:hypothetical protein [Candidatus Hydrogenedentota bacterium]
MIDVRVRCCLSLLMWAALCSGVLHAAEAEPLTNPGFEEGVAGWTTKVMRGRVAATTIPGEHGACLQVLGEAGARMKVTQRVAVRPQQWYRASFRCWAGPNGEGGGALGNLRIVLTDPNGKFIDYAGGATLLDTFGQWITVEAAAETSLSTSTLTLEFNASGASDFRLDDIVLEEIAPPAPGPNTWDELTTARETPLVFSSWQYNHCAEHFRQMGLKYGWRYRFEEQFDQLKESHTIGFWAGDEVYRLYADKGIRACIYLYHGAKAYRDTQYGGEPPADLPFFIDPVTLEGYVAACREACAAYGDTPGIDYFFVIDEPYKLYLGAIIPKAERMSPFWQELEQEVREQYGGGRFGLPDGPDDTDACRWIAYLGWATDQLVDLFARLREVIDTAGCGAKLLGPDEFGRVCPERWCDLAESVDVFTGQALAARLGASNYRPGAITKCAVDFTGKAVHNATQIPAYGGSPSPERVQELYSQVLRNGGDGQMLIAVEWFDRELNHHQYSAPARWASVKNYLRIMAGTAVQRPRDSRLGVLYSSPSAQALGPALADEWVLTAYALLGPEARAWPRMIDSFALGTGRADLDGLSVVVLPYGPYERGAVSEQLEAFVGRGGLLVCGEPGVLQHDVLGDALSARRLLGAEPADCGSQRAVTFSWPAPSRLRIHVDACAALRATAEDTRVVGLYDNGESAVTLRPFGKGEVLVFGFSPFAASTYSDDGEWVAWWRQVLAARDVALDLPIWDLRLPDEAVVRAEAPADVCITGNSFVRAQNGVYLGANDPLDGHYTLSVAPDLSPESGGTGPIAFGAGDLTDRALADKGPFEPRRREAKEPYREEDWADRWSGAALGDGLIVEFSWPGPRTLTRVRFWYSGAMPDLVIDAGDGPEPVRVAGADAGPDVERVEARVTGPSDYLRLRFAPGADEFALADVEIWAAR